MKKIISIFAALVMTLAMAVTVSAQDNLMTYVPTVYNDRNGLPTGEANAVVQTPDGYIWIGSYAGLIRYDGTNFRNFSEEGLVGTATVRSLFVDSAGRLWIGSNDTGVFCMENGRFFQPEGQPADSFFTIRRFAEGDNGDIYVSSSSGLARISGGVMTVFDIPEIAGQTVFSTAIDQYGRIWCCLTYGCCVIGQDGRFISKIDDGLIFSGGESIYSVGSGKDGSVWVGSDGNTLARVEFKSETLTSAGLKITSHDTGDVSTHNSITLLPDGGIVVTGLRGFGILHNGNFQGFGIAENAAAVEGFCMDYEGNLWIASSTYGVVKYAKGCYSTPDSDSGLSGKLINTIAGQGGYYFMGSDNGLTICTDKWKPVSNILTTMLNGHRIRHIIADSSGYVWIASYNPSATVIRCDPATWQITTFTKEDGLADRSARTLYELSDGSIAVGCPGGLSVISPRGKINTYTDLPYTAILCIAEGENGEVLAGSDGGGIYVLKDDKVTAYSYDAGLDNGIILRMVPDSEPGCWFVSTSTGMYYYNGSFRKLDNLDKRSGSIFDMYLVDNVLYMLQNSGIVAVSREDVIADNGAASVCYGFECGLSGSLYANTWHWLSPKGDLYLATSDGVSIFEFAQPESMLPKGIINSVNVDGVEYDHPNALSLATNAHRLTVDCAALSYTGTTRLSIAYQLLGFDEKETIVSGEKSLNVSYTNLPGGDYTFNMRIFLTDDPSQNATCSVNITKEKSFSEKPGFAAVLIFGAIAVAVGITIIILQARIRVINRRQKQYKDMVDQSLRTFAQTIDAKDKYTNGHSLRVAEYSREIARRMGMDKQEQERVYYIAVLHDIGKIGVPDSILTKPGRLTDEERQIIQRHPATGADILKNYTAIEGVADGARYHHERYDGKGYCEGLAGEDIPLVARIIGVADTYDAMSSKRCYRDSLSAEVIVEELKRVSGSQLDPDIVPHMLDMIAEGAAPIILPEDAQ
ncbi:MAG: HD domain-containing phosphohydrolase [Oscillospiraceae bacterium]